MKRLAFLVAASIAASGLYAAEAPSRQYLVGTRTVARRAPQALVRPLLAEESARTLQEFTLVDGFAATLTEEEVAMLSKSPAVRFIEPDVQMHAMELSPIPHESRVKNGQTTPYGIHLLGSAQLQPFIDSSKVIKVAVIDSGIDRTHPDLIGVYKGGKDFFANDDDPTDENGHGTHVAGTIAAADNAFGVLGMAPKIELFALRALGGQPRASGPVSGIIAAIQWAVENKINVINLSLGSESGSQLYKEAFDKAADAGVLAIAASGNDGADLISFPAAYPTVIAVGAIQSSGAIADFSNKGTELKLVAPGVGILSTLPAGTGEIAEIVVSDRSVVEALPMEGSPRGEVSGEFFFAGLGKPQDFTSEARGKIALIERGELEFATKAKNASDAGATAAVIFNREPGLFAGTLVGERVTNPFTGLLTLGISREDGLALKQKTGATLTVSSIADDYGESQGTSMASPHVAGAAALIWSVVPNATAAQVRDALLTTARDLGARGWDPVFGYGLVDVYAAAVKLAPEKFPSHKLRSRRR